MKHVPANLAALLLPVCGAGRAIAIIVAATG
jgi:hypothetical protein